MTSKLRRLIASDFKAIALSCLLFEAPVFPQTLHDDIEKFNAKGYNEELVISTDREIYVTGEHVWLKVYKLNGLAHIPLDVSKAVYIELLDRNNSAVRQVKVMIDGNSGSSDFILPDNISTGNYTLRAYTLWMQNFAADFFFHKTIGVVNPFESIEHATLPSRSAGADTALLFPEGGTLCAGRTNRISVRSFDKEGNPALMKGAVLRNGRDTVCKVVTGKNGFGIFNLPVKRAESYSLVFNAGKGSRRESGLPVASDEGIGLSAENNPGSHSFTVKILKSSPPSAGMRNLYFALVSGGTVLSMKELDTPSDSVFTISAASLPAGISQFLILDSSGSLVAGRYVYNQPDDRINLQIIPQKASYATREKVSFSIIATDNSGRPVEADLTASAVKPVVSGRSPDNWIGMNGVPDKGLKAMADASPEEINNYLISIPVPQSDTRKIMDPDRIAFRYLPELEGHQIRGHMRIKSTNEPLKDTDISFSYVGKIAKCQFGRTDENGEFSFLVKEKGFFEIVIQPLSPEVTDFYTEINQSFCDEFGHLRQTPFYIDSSSINALNNVIVSMQISNIYEPYREVKANTQKSPDHDFFGTPENTIKMSDYIELTTLREVVKEILPNVYTVRQNGKYDFRLINKFPGQPFTNTPLILVDGVPIYDFEKVLNINSRDIDKADILNTRYFFSRNVFDGIVSFVSVKGDLSVIEFDNTIFRQVYEGCQAPESFYSPDYGNEKLRTGRIPDFRNTLCWLPDLHTTKDGKAGFQFYSSDESGEYLVTVDAIAPDGKRGTARVRLVIE